MLARINSIHDIVHGGLPRPAGIFSAGTSYSAHDPALLTWVHATLLDMNLRVDDRFLAPLETSERDRYCAEAALIEGPLGIPEGSLPRSEAQLQQYMNSMLTSGQLDVTDVARALARDVLSPPWPLVGRGPPRFRLLPAGGPLTRSQRVGARAPRDPRTNRARSRPELGWRAKSIVGGMMQGAANAQVVLDMYSPMASDYEELWAPLLQPYGLRLLDSLSLQRARRVLDLGCGVGQLLPAISRRAPGAVVVGTDLTERMLRQAPSSFARVVMDGTRLGFVNQSFDAVVAAFVVFHFPDPLAALREVRRVLRPAGELAMAVWGTGQVFAAADAWNEELDAYGAPPDPAAAGPPDGEDQVNSVDKMASILEQAGFERVRAASLPWERAWTLEAFVDWRMRMGPSRRRLQRLDAAARATCVNQARERVAALPAEDFVDHHEVVVANGRAPG